MTQALDPLIRRYNVTAYFNGHDHSQQHIVSEDVHYFTQGAGSVTHQGFVPREPALFESDLSGFTALRFDPDSLVVYFFDDQANGLYNVTIPRPPENSESDSDGAVALDFSGGSVGNWLDSEPRSRDAERKSSTSAQAWTLLADAQAAAVAPAQSAKP